MNHKILSVLLLALGVGGTVSAIAVTNPGLIGLTSSVNWCVGLWFEDAQRASFFVTNRNPEPVKILGFSGMKWEYTLQPLEKSPEVGLGLGGTYDIRTELVARNEVKVCQNTITVTDNRPQSVTESLILETATWVNSTTYALNLRNDGGVDTKVAGYYVRDAGATATYQNLAFDGPTIKVNYVGTVYVKLESGSWTGTPFGFQEGFTYRIQVQTDNGTLLPEWQVPK